jgi:dCMP deaminase
MSDPQSTQASRAPTGRVVHLRPAWDDYFMAFAKLAQTRASCLRRQVGAVIVKDNMVLTTGYNGAPRGLPHAAEVGCLRDQLGVPSGERHELCRGLHAEQNAIIQAARHGIRIEGAVLYCTTHPCVICMKMVINAGLQKVYYLHGYPDAIAKQIIAEANFAVEQLQDVPLPSPPNSPPQGTAGAAQALPPGRRSLPILAAF